jgi:hypothetical protein
MGRSTTSAVASTNDDSKSDASPGAPVFCRVDFAESPSNHHRRRRLQVYQIARTGILLFLPSHQCYESHISAQVSVPRSMSQRHFFTFTVFVCQRNAILQSNTVNRHVPTRKERPGERTM